MTAAPPSDAGARRLVLALGGAAASPDTIDAAVAVGLASHLPDMLCVRRTARDLTVAPLPRPPPTAPLGPITAWLTGGAGRPKPTITSRRATPRPVTPWRGMRRATLPADGGLILPGLGAWGGAMSAVLDRRADLRAIAVLAPPIELDWPEYAAPDAVAALLGVVDGMARHAARLVAPDTSAARRLAALLGLPPDSPRLVVEPQPSVLADSSQPPFDPALADVPYVVACGTIEARANTLLLLHLWRDMLAAGQAVPRLVLAGSRGAQIEDIAPLLDWSETLRPMVAEAPGLDPSGLRALLGHARGLVAPDFAGTDEALLRDARACGLPVVRAGDPTAKPEGDIVLDPLDGRAWRDAVLALGPAPAPAPRAAVLPDWTRYAARIAAIARQA